MASDSQKQALESIREAEQKVTNRLADEQRSLSAELDLAKARTATSEESHKEKLLTDARQSLKNEKEKLGKTFEQAERDAHAASDRLAANAEKKKTEALDMLTKNFLSIFG